MLIFDKYIKSVLFLEELGKEIIFSKSGMCLLDWFFGKKKKKFLNCVKNCLVVKLSF